jgi:hypothetical protein
LLTVLTVLTELTALLDCFGVDALILMIRVPLLPSRVNAISMPSSRAGQQALGGISANVPLKKTV